MVLTQQKNGFRRLCWRWMKSQAASTNSSSQRLHPLPRQRARVLDPLLADAAPARVLLRVVLRRRPAAEHAARAEALAELLEAVLRPGSPDPPGPPRRSGGRGSRRTRRSRARSAGTRSCRRGGSCRTAPSRSRACFSSSAIVGILGLQPDRRAGQPDLAEPGAEDALAGDERRAPGGAALLAVGVGEAHPLVGDPVDVRRAVAHQPVAVAAEVRDPDVVAPDHEDVRLVRPSGVAPSPSRRRRTMQRKPRWRHRGVDHLRLARGRAVAQAVVRRAEVRAALDHPARDRARPGWPGS